MKVLFFTITLGKELDGLKLPILFKLDAPVLLRATRRTRAPIVETLSFLPRELSRNRTFINDFVSTGALQLRYL